MDQEIKNEKKKYSFEEKVEAYKKVYKSNLDHLNLRNQMNIKAFGLLFIFMIILLIITVIAYAWQNKAAPSITYTTLLWVLICVFSILTILSLYLLILFFIEYGLIKKIGLKKSEQEIEASIRKFVKFGFKKYPKKQMEMLEKF
ncbi:hypothetical protein [Mycoplasmopsis fermentans]|uniref:hypothetical protein n=1 Tax=Mycoplasmopsis fermentans TaxID=2115 RepID=UPI0001E32F92|nr:hypothetical protein [Mycoplasmopsis fermentans]ADN68752.1 conserved hypothetical membrane spanning protein [Mycoplasmopsis fermentans JER]RMX36298.1 hypothetical protein MFI2_0130 [Mycoplasmopsis fermentans MF-I2]RMX36376.1 hypothetical protein MFI1_0118 [Mycoplasmopsis fermentans MF-I1]